MIACCETKIHLPLPNFSCHFPLGLGAASAAASASGTSSMVSWTVAMVLRPGVASLVTAGASRMRALDVFFWRRE